MSLCLHRLSADCQARYGHPVALVETFVDPEQFCGTVYTASGWQEWGQTDGFGRVRRDFYVEHNKPKRLFARELCKNARRSLPADQLKPAWAAVEAKTRPGCTQSPAQPPHALAQPAEQAPAQNHHRFLPGPHCRTSSLCHPLPPRPPAKLSNLFVNGPWEEQLL